MMPHKDLTKQLAVFTQRFVLIVLLVSTFFITVGICCAAEKPAQETEHRMPEQVYTTELLAYPAQWAFSIPRYSVILTSDHDLEVISSNPDEKIDMSLTFDKDIASLRDKCEQAKTSGARTLIVSFDHFFQQYRQGQDHERALMPDMDEYIEKIAKVSKFAAQYGLGLELSLLTPLEIGRAYREETGESGVWMQYRKGIRDPKTGAYSVELWRQNRWANNKGIFEIEAGPVRVFAFREHNLHATPYNVVPEDLITEITDDINVEIIGSHDENIPSTRIRVYGKGKVDKPDLNKVLVVQTYRTPEMDFFSDKAKEYLRKLVDRYADAGVTLNALCSDEPHLMADWGYYNHHDHGQFAMRYVTPGFADKFAKKYGEKYRDFAKYLIYFTYGQEDYANDISAPLGVMHTFGASPKEIRETALFRSRYYEFLQDGLTDILVDGKRHAEKRMGHQLESRAHATWAESPTCDAWIASQGVQSNQVKYEYTSDFLWSNTVQQSAAACSDYFRWGDFLTGNGNDHAEGGFLDRDYYGLAIACSTGSINDIPYSYGAHWGMPNQVSHYRHLVATTFGVLQSHVSNVQGMVHRDVDVLMLYPIDLVSVEERFGSWMNQYGYANYITQQKLLEMGVVKNGTIGIAGRHYKTLVMTFEPFPSEKLLDIIQTFLEQGGKVVWSGPVPIINREGGDAYTKWSQIFGVDYMPLCTEGMPLPGRKITFEGTLKNVEPQIILTHFLVDHIYPVTVPNSHDTEIVAKVGRRVVGTNKKYPAGGSATFLGFRPLDNQSCSLGYDTRTWFDVLNAIGAYPGTKNSGSENVTEKTSNAVENDNTEFLSRTGNYIVCRFPNGAVSIANHLKAYEENWNGGFARNAKEDEAIMEKNPLPPTNIKLSNFAVNGFVVDYDGTQNLTFRADQQGNLTGFAGNDTNQITINGKTTTFSDKPLSVIVFTPVPKEQMVSGGAVFEIMFNGTGTVRIPFKSEKPVKVFAQGPTLGSKGNEVKVTQQPEYLEVELSAESCNRPLWVVPQ
ncbi:MAG: hypothetical protein ACRC2T_07395 [Thermoguttaceae bacterium]